MPSHTHSHTSHKPTPCQTTRIPCHTNTFGHARKPCNSACKCASETETDFVLQGSQANSGASRGLQVGFCASVTHAAGPPLALGIRTEICRIDGSGEPRGSLADGEGTAVMVMQPSTSTVSQLCDAGGLSERERRPRLEPPPPTRRQAPETATMRSRTDLADSPCGSPFTGSGHTNLPHQVGA